MLHACLLAPSTSWCLRCCMICRAFLQISRQAGDSEAEGRACVAYAECQQQLGQVAGAIESLEAFLQLARAHVRLQPEGLLPAIACPACAPADRMRARALHATSPPRPRTQAPRGQATACCKLGVLYQQQGKPQQAVVYLERFYELARSLGARLGVSAAACCVHTAWCGRLQAQAHCSAQQQCVRATACAHRRRAPPARPRARQPGGGSRGAGAAAVQACGVGGPARPAGLEEPPAAAVMRVRVRVCILGC